MRYREETGPDPDYPYTEGMHDMLMLSMVLSILIGAALLWLGRRGNVVWLQAWSVGLLALSAGYLVAGAAGWI